MGARHATVHRGVQTDKPMDGRTGGADGTGVPSFNMSNRLTLARLLSVGTHTPHARMQMHTLEELGGAGLEFRALVR